MNLSLQPGKPYPLGASRQDEGINFAVYSPQARRLELCLFDAEGRQRCVDLPGRSGDVWHGWVPGLGGGHRYGFRSHGDNQPDRGLCFNPAKLLIDPYAQALSAPVEPHSSLYPGQEAIDSADAVPKALTPSADDFDWHNSPRPNTPWSKTVLYEVHVKGFSQQNPAIPAELRGTYLGLAHPASLAHLTALGITAVQLMPCFAFMTERRLAEMGLHNYWGYNPVAWFAPEPSYAVNDAVTEFKTMVRALHQAGLEVIMDVVYNHSAEANQQGPLLNLKGLANGDLYRHPEHHPGDYLDFTGCHNSLDISHPATLQLVMDSLRHWRRHYRIDGFRFDLAVSLGRDPEAFSSQAAFFRTLYQEPTLAGCKLIAEPWDLGPDGYRVGQFPDGWVECNDFYRDVMRRFWRGDGGQLSGFIEAFAGSAARYRGGSQSLNLVTYHDGFTLADLVSYQQRHNLANGEDNRDGHGDNASCNWGAEGPTDDPNIQAQRRRSQRNLLATLLLTPGPVHLLGGDEIGRSQAGNNNAYCQDNALSWFNWADPDNDLAVFVRDCIALRRELEPVLSNRSAWQWLLADGTPAAHTGLDQRHNVVVLKASSALALLFNASAETVGFSLEPTFKQLRLSSDPQTTLVPTDNQAPWTLGPWTMAVIQTE